MVTENVELVTGVQNMDNTAVHWMKRYPENNVIGFHNTFPLNSDLASGENISKVTDTHTVVAF